MAAKNKNLPASAWDDWTIIRRIQSGGFGVLYEAERRSGELRAMSSAIKIIPIPNEKDLNDIIAEKSHIDHIEDYIEKLKKKCEKEIDNMIKLRGRPNIVNIEDYKVISVLKKESKVDGGQLSCFEIQIRMELLPGNLKNYYEKKSGLTEEEVVKIGTDICTALEICANIEKGPIVHRDIKPSNILFTHDNIFKLCDFGIAREMNELSVASMSGTFPYMAPEMRSGGNNSGPLADIYSLGIVLHRLMNGNNLPWEDSDKLKQILDSGKLPPKPINASDKMAKIIMKACAYDQKNRYQSAADLKSALESISNPASINIVYTSAATKRPVTADCIIAYDDGEIIGTYTTDRTGKVTIQNLTAGTYIIKEKSGAEKKEITLHPGDKKTVGLQKRTAPVKPPIKKKRKGIIAAVIIAVIAVAVIINNAGNSVNNTLKDENNRLSARIDDLERQNRRLNTMINTPDRASFEISELNIELAGLQRTNADLILEIEKLSEELAQRHERTEAVLQASESSLYKESSLIINGISFDKGYIFEPSGHTGPFGGLKKISWASYNLNDYHWFSAVAGYIGGSGDYDAVLRIFCDGILEKEIMLYPDFRMRNIQVDVTGVKELKIEVEGKKLSGWSPFRSSVRSPSYGLANPGFGRDNK